MKYLKIIVIFLLLTSIGLYGLSLVKARNNQDDTYPVITSDLEVLEINCNYNESDLLKGLHARDEKDGDLSDDILVANLSHFSSLGVSEVTYVVFDHDHHSTTFKRTVIFNDYRSPQINLSKPLLFSANSNSDVLSSLNGNDLLDGDITTSIILDNSNVNYQVPGDYSIDVSLTNSFGDLVNLTLPVHVVESDRLSIDIQLSSYLVYLNQGDNFNPNTYLNQVFDSNGNQVSTRLVDYQNNVDTSKAGVYEVKYAINVDGKLGLTYLTVIVND